MRKKLIHTLFLLVVLTASYFFDKSVFQAKHVIPQTTPTPTIGQIHGEVSQTVRVSKIIDGDTIQIETGQKVRYIGINTPETRDPRKKVECFGKEASEKNKELVEGKTVRLEKDISETDKYGRLLRYVFLIDKTATSSPLFINDYLVREGYAQASTYSPDIKYQQQFLEAQREAREGNNGLWKNCDIENNLKFEIRNFYFVLWPPN